MAYQLLAGHILNLPLASESIHTVITSIPYWGLRAYLTPPQIWGGVPDCEHEFDTRRYYTEKSAATSSSEAFSEPGEANASRLKEARWRQDDTCRKCGAWRGEMGLEPTPEMFVSHVVQALEEVKRVLRKDGSIWLNIGDSFACAPNGRSAQATRDVGNDDRTFRDKPMSTLRTNSGTPKYRDNPELMGQGVTVRKKDVLKEKDLIGMPWRVALALQAAGWWLRADCIWSKTNPMPNSVKDRPAISHEYVFLMTKSARYFYDDIAVREGAIYGPRVHSDSTQSKYRVEGVNPGHQPHSLYFKKTTGPGRKAGRLEGSHGAMGHDGNGMRMPDKWSSATRNLRSIWSFPTQSLSAKKYGSDVEHFAAFPEKMVERPILASTSEKGCCAKCGAPWIRITAADPRYALNFGRNTGADSDRAAKGYQKHSPSVSANYITMSWEPTCACHGVFERTRVQATDEDGTLLFSKNGKPRMRWDQKYVPSIPLEEHPVVPCRVLDPFVGSGTTCLVAERLGRDSVGVDLKLEYLVGLAAPRVAYEVANPRKGKKQRREKALEGAVQLKLAI